jgi:hypothetical protein
MRRNDPLPFKIPTQQESAAAQAEATEGANSHERSGSVLHITIAVWRDFTLVKHRRSKAWRATPG